MYIILSFIKNKSVLNWTQVCQLHCKTQSHELIVFASENSIQASLSFECCKCQEPTLRVGHHTILYSGKLPLELF
jgi:hypothetical protein